MNVLRRLQPLLLIALASCVARSTPESTTAAAAPAPAPAPAAALSSSAPDIPAGSNTVAARLAASPRHAEWVMIPAGGADSVRAWVVYPERRDRAPVVLVVHEIFGLSSWIRGVSDQLAADGFIAIAPDLLTGHVPVGPGDSISFDAARAAIRGLDTAEVHRRLDAIARYGMALPAAAPSYGVVGFCWGGSTSFAHAVHSAAVGAAVVYYGGSPPTSHLANIRAPVLGLYGGNDARVNATIARADSAMKHLGRTFDYHIVEGAGHGFLRGQEGANGANAKASREAWPKTIAWFDRHLKT